MKTGESWCCEVLGLLGAGVELIGPWVFLVAFVGMLIGVGVLDGS